jgi:hypothetical protein
LKPSDRIGNEFNNLYHECLTAWSGTELPITESELSAVRGSTAVLFG